MAVPKRNDKMISNAMKRNAKIVNMMCERQFPDCPEEHWMGWMIDENQLTLEDVMTKRCRLWSNCEYHDCKDCYGYHDPRKHPRIE